MSFQIGIVNFLLGKLENQHVCFHCFAPLPTTYNENRRSILFHIWKPTNPCITRNQDCQHTYLSFLAM
jgi:hypothetical protein